MRYMKKIILLLWPLWACLAWAAPGEFSNTLQKLIIDRTHAGALELRLAMQSPLVRPPESFSLDNPPRIVIDLPGVGNELGRSKQELNQGSLRNAEIIQGDDRTRLIIHLNQPQSYRGRMDGNDFVLALSGSGSDKAEAGNPPNQPALQAIDFHRGKNGEGRVEIDLSDVNINVDVHQQGKRLLVDFSHASLPPALRRKLEVIDFGTPVQTVDTFVQDGLVRMVIEPKGNWEYASYQTDTRLVVEVKPIVEDPTRLAKGNNNGYTGDKLSLNFQNITVREALNVIADFTGLNIVISDSVSGSLTLRLKDVPWDQALDIIMQSRGLDMRKYGNVVQVAPNKEIADRAKEDVAKKKVLDELEPTQTEAFPFSYANAKDAKQVIDSYLKNRLKTAPAAVPKAADDPLAAATPAAAPDAGMIAVDERTNTLYITAPLSVLEKVRDLIKKLDVPVRQVMIEARVVEASDKFGRSLGARLGMNGFGPTPLATPGTPPAFGVFGAPNNMGGTLNGTNVNLPVANAAGTFSLMLFNATASRFLNLEITAQETDGKSHVISSPRVVTADQSEAIIEQGTEIPYQAIATAGGVATTTVAFKKAVLSLKVKPQITPEENVIMNVTVSKDTVGTLAINGVPTVDTNKVQTQVLVENGGTVVIGGVHTQTDQTTTTKVPMLGDVPVLGTLFRNKARTNNKTELLIFLSPKVLKNSLAR